MLSEDILNTETLLRKARRTLERANEELHKTGYTYAELRGGYKKEFAKKCYTYSQQLSANKSAIMAEGDLAELKGAYEKAKIYFETEKEVCRNIATQVNALQSLLSSIRKEYQIIGD